MKLKYVVLIVCLRNRKWRGAWYVVKTVARAIAWPFCRKCGKFGWHGGSIRCWPCQKENLLKALLEAEKELAR